MPRGRIRTLVSHRGFGFILPEEEQNSAKELFFHRTDVQGVDYEHLRVDQQVEYDLGMDQRRGTTKATNVRPVEGA